MTSKAIVEMILVGRPQILGKKDAKDPMESQWESGIVKHPVEGKVWLGKTNLTGDGQADLKHHGGPDKAVLAYSSDHYPLWQNELDILDFRLGALGENFAIQGQTEETVCIGDIYQIGEAIVQVSQPRLPCWKPARLWKIKDLALQIQNKGRTGWYFRVLQEGYVEKGQSVVLLERSCPEWTIAVCNQIMHFRKDDREAAAKLAACELLANSWRETLRKRA
ncbi:MOSC domain-containing protein [Thermoflavimicrobium dichotomicum]|uniref:MOSC domain-containing protein YiiM n=1 Tax=Thermoflavimicrobium dichotomicum TaxID=46223 RepID=A0A1I3RAJ1_9BACL|nr:MOSC domain-containing protein [Thermoflavimicrobium dichotomicum]SFJ43338.1 MOSC domain-containing protein YiiM [Thermoflavimicrobium dichotomicum]